MTMLELALLLGLVEAYPGLGCPLLCAPDDPSTPFGSPLLALYDGLRVLMALVTLAVVVATPWAISRCFTSGQRSRFIALALYAVALMITNTDHLGDEVGVRFVVNLAAVAYSAHGLWRFRREAPGAST